MGNKLFENDKRLWLLKEDLKKQQASIDEEKAQIEAYKKTISKKSRSW